MPEVNTDERMRPMSQQNEGSSESGRAAPSIGETPKARKGQLSPQKTS